MPGLCCFVPAARTDGHTMDCPLGAQTGHVLTVEASADREGTRKEPPVFLQLALRRISFQYSFTRVFAQKRPCVYITFSLFYRSQTCCPFDVELLWVFPPRAAKTWICIKLEISSDVPSPRRRRHCFVFPTSGLPVDSSLPLLKRWCWWQPWHEPSAFR